MGSLILPASGLVHLDTQVLVYSVERHPSYGPLLQTLWSALRAGTIGAVSSELALMEVLVRPIRSGDVTLQNDYERVLNGMELRLLPITQPVLREAARLRAAIPSLRTPDALHAATASLAARVQFLTNDRGFRRVPGLVPTRIDDVLASP